MDPREIKTHPKLSSLFSIDPKVQDAIAQSMRAMGYVPSHPIEVGTWPGQDTPVVVDGHTRLNAALREGLQDVPVFEIRFTSENLAIQYALHNQRNRRNLSAAELYALIQAVDRPFAHGGDRKSENQVDPGPLKKTSLKETAQSLGVSQKTVQRSRTIASDPEVEAKVKSGEIPSLKEGARQVQEKRRQDEAQDVSMPARTVSERLDAERKARERQAKEAQESPRTEDAKGVPRISEDELEKAAEGVVDQVLSAMDRQAEKMREAQDPTQDEKNRMAGKMRNVCEELWRQYSDTEMVLLANIILQWARDRAQWGLDK